MRAPLLPQTHGHLRTAAASLLTLATLGLAMASMASPVRAATNVFGNITSDTTWNFAGSPYVLQNDVTINTGVTLTIEPGVEVKGAIGGQTAGGKDGSRLDILVEGTLIADGTGGDPILFTSPNGAPAEGDWYGLSFTNPDSSGGNVLKNVVIEYARTGLRFESVGAEELEVDGLTVRYFSDYGIHYASTSDVDLSNVLIEDTEGSPDVGIYVQQAPSGMVFTDITSRRAYYGISVYNASITVQRYLAEYNTQSAIFFGKGCSSIGSLVLEDSTLYANGPYGVTFDDDCSSWNLGWVARDSVISGHGTSTFYNASSSSSSSYRPSMTAYNSVFGEPTTYTGSFTNSTQSNVYYTDPLMVDPANGDYRPTTRSPMRNQATGGGDIGLFPFDPADPDPTPGYLGWYWEDATWPADVTLDGDVIVPEGSTLTIPAGATVRANDGDQLNTGEDDNRVEIRVEGTLAAEGTEAEPIVFESGESTVDDDDWYGIYVPNSSATLTLTHATFRDALRGLTFVDVDGSYADLLFENNTRGLIVREGSNMSFTNVTANHNVTGVFAENSVVSITEFFATGNTGEAFYTERTSTSYTADVELNRCVMHDNEVGLEMYMTTSSGNHAATLSYCTITHQLGDGFYLYDSNGNSSHNQLWLYDSVVAYNTDFAYRSGQSTSDSDYQPRIYHYRSLLWGNGSERSTNNIILTGSDPTRYNPLFADPDARDYEPTHRSPLRHMAGDDTASGYYDHVDAQTPGYHGWYWYDFTFPQGEYLVEGDIVISGRKIPGSGDPDNEADDVPPEVQVPAGSNLLIAADTDVMGGGIDDDRVEIVVHGQITLDGTSQQNVVVKSNGDDDSQNDWYGVRVPSDAYAANIMQAELSNAIHCVWVEQSDHVINDLVVHDCQRGLYLEGGDVSVDGVEAYDNDYGVFVEDGGATIDELVAYDNEFDGLYHAPDASGEGIDINRCLLHHNGRYGAHLTRQTTSNITEFFDQCTIAYNDETGVYASKGSTSGNFSVQVTNSSVTHNGNRGFRGGSSSSSTWPNVSITRTNVWGNVSGNQQYTNYGQGTGNDSYNPLYVAGETGNFAPTSRSPLRCMHQDGIQAAGYEPYVGDETGQVIGYLHGDMTLNAAGSPYDIQGDIIVDSKCTSEPVTLTIEPGTVLQMARDSDLMGGGDVTSRIELRVFDMLDINGQTAQVQLISGDLDAPTKGDWDGVRIYNGGVVDARGVLVQHVRTAFWGYADAETVISDCELRMGDDYGVYFNDGEGGRIEDCFIRDFTDAGIYLANLDGLESGPTDTTPLILRNFIIDNGTYSVRADNTNVKVIGNVLMGANDYGFYGYRSQSTTRRFHLINNTIHEHDDDCVYVRDDVSSGVLYLEAFNNILSYCGDYAFRDAGAYDTNANGTMDYNNFFETLNYQSGASHSGFVKGANSTSFDPRYEDIDPSGTRRWFDLRLLNDSPMLNAGTLSPDDVPTTDLLGVTRPMATACGGTPPGIDLGAYEYDPCANHDPWAAAGEDLLVPMLDLVCFSAAESLDPDEDPMVFEWTFGDGVGASGTVVCHTFTNNVFHEVILTATDPFGGIDHDVVMVDVNHRPVADAGPEVYAAAGGDFAQFIGSNSYDPDGSVVTYEWDFGLPGAGSAEVNPSFQYPPGPSQDYIVTLTVTDNDGHSDSETTVAHIIGTDDTQGPLILHTPIADGRPAGQAVTISATITDFSDVTAATLFYRASDSAIWLQTPMTKLGGTTWSADIPANSVTQIGVDYYIQATDGYVPVNIGTEPIDAPASFLSFDVDAPDTVGPTILHTPILSGQAEGQLVTVQAQVTDISDVASVTLFYKVASGSVYASTPMLPLGDGNYTAEIPAFVVTASGVDYYVLAVDESPNANTSTDPPGAPGVSHMFAVDVADSQGPAIVHTPVVDGQTEGTPVIVEATVTDDSDVAEVQLLYRRAGDPSFSSVPMADAGSGVYQATIPGSFVTTAGVQYYLYAEDSSAGSNASVLPSAGFTSPFAFTVVSTDVTGPAIAHTPIADERTQGDAVTVSAVVIDAAGVDSVTLRYRAFGADDWIVQPMAKGTGDEWSGSIPTDAVLPPALEYYLEAVDSSLNANESLNPSSAPALVHKFTVIEEDVTGPAVVHAPVLDGQLSGQPVGVTASVSDVSGVNSVTLFYRPTGGAWANAPMQPTGPQTWAGNIPGGAVTALGVEYYLVAIDGSPATNETTYPADGEAAPLSFTVETADLTGPVITHTEVPDGVPTGVTVAVTATLQDPSGLDSAVLYYRLQGQASFTAVAMTPSVGQTFVAEIPGGAVQEPAVQYYIEVVDASPNANGTFEPNTAPAVPHSFTVTPPDLAGPSITHTPIADGQAYGAAVTILATLTDSGGVTGATLFYKPGDAGTYSAVAMTVASGATWQGAIPGFAATGEEVDYYIVATDTSGNDSFSPLSAPANVHTFTVTPADLTPPSINHLPVVGTQIAGQDIAISALVTDASGVSVVRLHYRPVGGSAFQQVQLLDGDQDGTFTGTIPGFAVTAAGVEYYISAIDVSAAANEAVVPTTAPSSPYEFQAAVPDVSAPTVVVNPVGDGQPVGTAVAVEANVTDDTGVEGVSLVFRPVGEAYTSVEMVNTSGTTWSAQIPGYAVTVTGVEYYLVASDAAGNNGYAPTFPLSYSFTTSSEDLVGPTIAHLPIEAAPSGEDLVVTASVTDTSGIGAVTLYYRTTGTAGFLSLPMAPTTGSVYSATIPGVGVSGLGLDYYLTATDASGGSNASAEPAGAPTLWHGVTIAVPDATGPDIVHAPVLDGQAEGSNVSIQASVTDTSGVVAVTLHARPIGSPTYSQLALAPAGGNVWAVTLPGYLVVAPGVEYYLSALDGSAFLNTSFNPAAAGADPHTFTVVADDAEGPTIAHTPIADGQPVGEPVALTADVEDVTGVDSVTLAYRAVGGSGFSLVVMTPTGADGAWEGEIPGFAVTSSGVEYYITAEDQTLAGNVSTTPVGAPAALHSFTGSVTDLAGPTITAAPVADGQPGGEGVAIDAIVADPSGVAGVTLFYRTFGSGASWDTAAMADAGAGLYTGTIPGAAVEAPLVEWYVQATDAAPDANVSVWPAGSPGEAAGFTVTVPDTEAPSLVHTAPGGDQPAGVAVALAATVSDPSGVASVTAYFRPSGELSYTQIPLAPATGGAWEGAIPAGFVTAPGFQYYLEAADASEAGNTVTAPAGGAASPFTVTVVAPDGAGPAITHTPIGDGQPAGQAVTVTATAGDASDVAGVMLAYRPIGESSFSMVPMAYGGGSLWTAAIPAFAVTTAGVQYYLIATDASAGANQATDPASAPGAVYTFTVMAMDLAGPSVAIDPFPSTATSGEAIALAATVTDASGLANVSLVYRTLPDGLFQTVAMAAAGDDRYTASIPGGAVAAPGVAFYLSATDAAAGANATLWPAGSPDDAAEIAVADADLAAPTVALTPVADGQPEGQDVTVQATASDTSGVASVTLYVRPLDAGAATWTQFPMTESGGTFDATIPGYLVGAAGVAYYVRAVDAAPAANSAMAPTDGPTAPATFTVTPADADGPSVGHLPLPSNQPAGLPVTVSATAVDPAGVAGLTLLYRPVGNQAFSAIAMVESGGSYTADIPGFAVTSSGVEYYLRATDALDNASTLPVGAPGIVYSFSVQVLDGAGPTIAGMPVMGDQPVGQAVTLTVDVADPSGVDEVVLSWRLYDEALWTDVVMTQNLDGLYEAALAGVDVETPGIAWYVTATDASTAGNVSVWPAGGQLAPSLFDVVELDVEAPALTHAPITDGKPAGQGVPVAVQVTDESAIVEVNLHVRPSDTTLGGEAFQVYELALSELQPLGGGLELSTWTGAVPGFVVIPPGTDYYLEAIDAGGNVATDPVEGADAPHKFSVADGDLEGPVVTVANVPDGQPALGPVTVTAEVSDASGVGTATLLYRPVGGSTFSAVGMEPGDGDSWSGVIPGYAVSTAGVQYYVRATDGSPEANATLSPLGAPGTLFTFAVSSEDEAGPSLVVAALDDSYEAGSDVTVFVTATDASGVGSATLTYRNLADVTWTDVALTEVVGQADTWSATIPGGDVAEPGVAWYVTATDGSPAMNASVYPTGAPGIPSAFTVVVPDTAAPSITHAPMADGQAQGSALTLTAQLDDASGIASATAWVRPGDSGPFVPLQLAPLGGGLWQATIPTFLVLPPSVSYYLEVVDAAPAANTSLDPMDGATAPWSFTVTGTDLAGPALTVTPVADGQPAGEDVAVVVEASDASDVVSVSVFWRLAGATAFSEVPGVYDADDGTWTCIVPDYATAGGADVEYWVRAVDGAPSANAAVSPPGAPSAVLAFSVDLDTDLDAPSVLHTPIASGQAAGQPLSIAAQLSDASGIGTARVHARPQGGGAFVSFVLAPTGGGVWEATLPGYLVQAPGVDYYLEVLDAAATPNSVLLPAGGASAPFSFGVAAADVAGPTLTFSPPAGPLAAGVAVAVNAAATDPAGVAGVTLFVRPQGGGAFTALPLAASTGSTFTGELPAWTVTGSALELYVLATDTLGNSAASPVGAPAAVHTVVVIGDDPGTGVDQPPTIAALAVADGQPVGQAVTVTATAAATPSVASVVLYYRTEGAGGYASKPLIGSGGVYAGTIPGTAVQVPGVEWYVEATAATTGLTATWPATPPAAFSVVATDDEAPSITHTPVADGQAEGQAVEVTASVTDDSAVASAVVEVRVVGTSTWIGLAMAPQGGSSWATSIPGGLVTPAGVEYRLRATDASGNLAVAPSGAPYAFSVVPADVLGPMLTHTPPVGTLLAGEPIALSVDASDASGVASVRLHYRPIDATGGGWASVSLGAQGDGGFSGSLPAFAVTEPGVEYWFEATDASAAENMTSLPADAPDTVFGLVVTTLDDEGPALSHTPVTGGIAEGEPFTIVASATDASTVASVTLYWRLSDGEGWTAAALDGSPGSDVFTTTLPGESIVGSTLQYTLVAADAVTPAPNQTWLPPGAPNTWFEVAIEAADTAGPSVAVSPLPSTLLKGDEVVVTATVADPSGVEAVTLYWRPAGGGAFKGLPMAALGGGEWQAVFDTDGDDATAYEMYVRAVDGLGNTTTAPEGGADAPQSFDVQLPVDDIPPVLLVAPIADGQTAGVALPVTIEASDANGIEVVRLFHRVVGTDASWAILTLSALGGGRFGGTIPAGAVDPPGVEYYLLAADGSAEANEALWPAGAPDSAATFTVTEPLGADEEPPVVLHTPIGGTVEEGSALTISAVITDERSSVGAVTLTWRTITLKTGQVGEWQSAAMARSATTDTWVGQLPPSAMKPGEVHYYLEVSDDAATPNSVTVPAQGEDGPYVVTVVARTTDGGGTAGAAGATCAGASGGEGSGGPMPPLGLVLGLAAALWLARRRRVSANR